MTLDDVEGLEEARCAAMLAADVVALDHLLSAEIRWAHAGGKVDDKAAMLEQFGSGTMRCYTINRSENEARIFGPIAVVTGVVRMDAMAGSVRKQVHSRYSGVWFEQDGQSTLVNWHSGRLG